MEEIVLMKPSKEYANQVMMYKEAFLNNNDSLNNNKITRYGYVKFTREKE